MAKKNSVSRLQIILSFALIFGFISHDRKAIKSHWLNHPDAGHFTKDIITVRRTWQDRKPYVFNWLYDISVKATQPATKRTGRKIKQTKAIEGSFPKPGKEST